MPPGHLTEKDVTNRKNEDINERVTDKESQQDASREELPNWYNSWPDRLNRAVSLPEKTAEPHNNSSRPAHCQR